MDRIAAPVVQAVHFGRDGRESAEDRVRVMVACNKAEVLTCTYGNLLGLYRLLDWGNGLTPCFNFRRTRFRQCGLTPSDVIQFFSCAPRLESAVFVNERLGGMDEAFQYRIQPLRSVIQTVEFTDCGLTGNDAAALLERLPHLRSVHFQAMDLSGLETPQLPGLEEVRLLDCCLRRSDVLRLLSRCPNLRHLVLCGNPLGEEAPCEWPEMPRLRHADFRHCELSVEDEEALQAKLPTDAQLERRIRLLEAGSPAREAAPGCPGQTARHVVFDSESGSDGEESD